MVPIQMKALVFHGESDLRFEACPFPTPGPDEALIRMGAVGICGSDVHGYLGKTGRRTPPMVMGHEFAGTIEQVGAAVKGLHLGQPVAVFPYTSCGNCANCREGATASCPDKRMFGVFNVNGGMAEYAAARSDLLIPLPAGAEMTHAALAEPLSVAAHGLEKAGLRPDSRLAIVGAGAIGLMCLVLARQQGVGSIAVLDIAADRLDLARKLGAGKLIQAGCDEVPAAAADVVIEAVGVENTLAQAVRLSARGGKVIVLGMSQRVIPLEMYDLVSREIQLEGSFNYNFIEFQNIVTMLPVLREYLDRVISHVVPLRRGVEMFSRLAKGEAGMRKVILTGGIATAGKGAGLLEREN
jgi:threonine dehydrogenase-like Zn-dependent dehydrogenase